MEIVDPRKLPKKSRVKNLINFYSWKNERHVWCESYLERDFCQVCDYKCEIVSYESQPMTVRIEYNGKSIVYTPDLLIHTLGGSPTSKGLVVEIKSSEQYCNDQLQRKLAKIRMEFELEGYGFAVWTDVDLPSDDTLDNIRLLTRYKNSLPSKSTIQRVIASVKANDDMTVSELNYFIRKLEDDSRIFGDYRNTNVYSILANGMLVVDMSEKIVPTTVVTMGVQK